MSTDKPGRDLYFWFDCETTGLDPYSDTVLEVAWCFTDEHLKLITPLRQRYTMIAAPPSSRHYRTHGRLDPTEEDQWHDNDYISPVARQMHETSGLYEAWLKADENAQHSVLTHSRDLYRLVAEDLSLIGATRQDRLVLAGAGVSHFDDSVLAEAFDQLYPRRPVIGSGTSPLGSWHYRCFDTSVALWVANAREQVEELSRRLGNPPDSDGGETLPFDLIECEKPVDAEVDHLMMYDINNLGEFLRFAATPHRAADDVVYSLLDARALRYLVSGR